MRAFALPLVLLLAACGSNRGEQANLAQLDADLTGNAAADPALTGALKDQIMVDPQLAQQSNADALRPPPQPASGAVPPDDIAARKAPAEHDAVRSAPAPTSPCPQCTAAREALTLGALAGRQGKPGGCADKIAYSATWANKLPAGVPLYPDARVLEAAGADGKGCALRVVSFASAASVQHLLDWYFTKVSAAGYTAQHHAERNEHALAGTRAAGGAFLLTVRPRKGGGSEADLMADGG